MQRRFAGFVCCVYVRATFDKSLNHVKVLEKASPVQRRLLIVVWLINIGSGLNQRLNGVYIAVSGRDVERRPACLIALFKSRAMPDQNRDDCRVIASCG